MGDIRLMRVEDSTQLSNLALPPNNVILLDDRGKPSVMVKIPKMTYEDLGLVGGSNTHPAWIVNGEEVPCIYISKYQNIVEDGRAYSLPMQQPACAVSYDQAKAYCEAKGKGWHLVSNIEWAAIAQWCKMNGCMPYGNNEGGNYSDTYNTSDKGIPMPYQVDEHNWYQEFTATGSGPKNWFHNNDFSGIADLNGNINEWVGGVRVKAGELQVIEDNNTAMGVDESATSPLWRAINQDNEYVDPGSDNTITFGSAGIETSGEYRYATVAEGVTIPHLVEAHCLFPNDAEEEYRADYYYASTSGEKFFVRGGGAYNSTDAGVFFFDGVNPRDYFDEDIGFRAAYIPL